MAFNLLPVPPLDGITALGLLLSEQGARQVGEIGRNPSLTFVGIFLAWNLFGYVYDPLFGVGLRLLFPDVSYR
jgi:Zn-dependent protease